MVVGNWLFSSGPLSDVVEERKHQAVQTIDHMDPDRILTATTPDLVEEIVHKFGAGFIAIEEDRMEQMPTREVEIDVSQDPARFIADRRRRFMLKGTAVDIAVPFQGHPDLFRYRPSNYFVGAAPEAIIRGDELIITFEAVEPTAEQLKQYVDRQLDLLRQSVPRVNTDLAAFDSALPAMAEERIEARKKKLQADRGLEGSLGIPIRKRGDAPKPVPMVRKRLGLKEPPSRPDRSSSPYQDEYRLEDAQYEEIIDIILSMGRAFERTPSTFVKLNEEQLRDHILLQLNGTFEGAAGGEMFNGEGKTDILVRIENRNAFIGECKIWDGEKAFGEGIDQLRGYLVWRDSKAALVLFIGRKDVSAIIEKAENVIRGHPNFKRDGPATADASTRRNYVLFQEGDRDREISVALLPLALPRLDDEQ
jgi:hypothetical protein